MTEEPTTCARDRAARGPLVRFTPAVLAMQRCPRCHSRPGRRRFQGDRSIFLGLGVPCAMCSPIKASDVYALVGKPNITLTFWRRP